MIQVQQFRLFEDNWNTINFGDRDYQIGNQLKFKAIIVFERDFIVPVSRTQMYRQFGNSVAIPVVRAIAKEMKKTILCYR